MNKPQLPKLQIPKNEYTQTAFHILVVVLALIFLILMSAGFRFDMDKFADVDFWGDVAARLFLALVVFNLAYADFFKSKKRDRNSRYYYAAATKQLKVKVIYAKRLFADLDEAIKAENKDRYIAECDRRLHKVSRRMNYSDLPLDENGVYIGEKPLAEWFADIMKTFAINEKLRERLYKVVTKIINGQVKVKPITADDILIETEDNDALRPMTFSEKKAQTFSAMRKALLYAISSIGLVVISYDPTWTDFMFNLISNLILSFGAVAGGMSEADRNVKLKTAVFERHNAMLANRLGIAEEYTPRAERQQHIENGGA